MRKKLPLNTGFFIILSILVGYASAAILHFELERPPSFRHTGWTIYLNDILGLREFESDFGASKILSDPRSNSFVERVAKEARQFYGEDDRDLDVWMIPFTGYFGYDRGWPFQSGRAETVVYVDPGINSKLKRQLSFRITEDGGPSFRIAALLLNGVIYSSCVLLTAFLTQKVLKKFSRPGVGGFPIIEVAGTSNELPS